MKKMLPFLFLLICLNANAQNSAITSIAISLPANPDANTANWNSGTSLLTITANPKMDNGRVSSAAEESKILVFIRKNGVRVCGAFNTGTAPIAGFFTATKVWSGNQAIALLGQTCTLVPGSYEIVVQFFGTKNGATISVSDEKIKAFTIPAILPTQYQAPQNLAPADAHQLTQAALSAPIIFKWAPVTPSTGTPVKYRLKIWQLMVGQSTGQAIMANQPLVTKDVNASTQTVVTSLISGPCTAPYRCEFVWNVQALNTDDIPIGPNNGTSTPTTFGLGNTNIPLVSTGVAAVGDTISAGFEGEFKIVVAQIAAETDGSITGKGTVTVPWLSTNIAVEFSKIRIDLNKRLTAGGIVTEKSAGVNYIQSWLTANLTAIASNIPVDGVVNWTNNQVNNVVAWANNNNYGFPDINYQANITAPPIPPNSLKMPFGVKFSNADDKLMITEIVFKPNVSKINFLVQKEFTKGVNDYKLGFTGKYFEIHPKRIDFSNGRVDLVEDISIPNLVSDPKMKFVFKKGVSGNGCFIEWDSTGVKNIGLALDVKFSRDWLLPMPTSPDSVKATVSGNGTSMHDILLTGNLPNCEIVGTNGIKISVNSLALDLSDTRNPAAMNFPTNYTSDTTTVGRLLWKGFYIKTLGLTLPDTWKTGASPTQITATNTIIDDQGVTMKIKAKNVITFPQGRVSDMSASLDTLELSILKGSLTEGRAKGKLVLPISNETLTNTLKYTATFAQAGGANNFQIVVLPSGPIDADILKGKITLSPTSTITASLSNTVKSMTINLNGSFDWGGTDLSVIDTATNTGAAAIRKKGIKGIKFQMDFQNLSLGYTSNSALNTNGMTFNPGTWSFASPQKRLANFPVTVKKVYYKQLTTVAPSDPNLKELLRGALMIDIVANLTDDIGGSTTVGGAFAVQMNKSAIKFLPKFKGVFIEDIEVHADMPAVKIDGKLKMYDNDPVYGDGFLATLGVTFTAVSIQANALVQFGNTTYNNNNQYYRYWRAEADVKFNPGIPFLTGVGFYGFGGGAFYNMEAQLVTKTAPEVGFKYTFKPKKSSLGFSAMATIATLPKFETFNADVKLLAQFNANTGGLTKIGFTGDFWLAAKLEEREPNAKIKGGVAVEYNFVDKIFYMSAALGVNVPPAIVTPAPVGFVLNINGTTNKWYFKAGTPTSTNTVRIFGVDLYSYLMFGNDIPAPTGFTTKFFNNYLAATGSSPSLTHLGTGGVDANTATGKGIAAGIGIEFSKNITKDLLRGLCRQWSIGGTVLAGAELNLSLMHQNGCIGINGYRASGWLGLYGSVNASITGTSFTKACGNKSINLFKIKAGAWVTGKFPNPEYIAGALSADIDLFDGLLKTHYDETFERGEDCNGTAVVTADAAQEDEAGDFKNKLIQSVAPTSKYNFPITSPIDVRYGLVPDRIFDVSENQGDGTTKNRTFKMVVTKTLEIKNASGNWVPITLKTKVNNLGEHQYYIGGTINTTPAFGQNKAANLQVLNVNTGNTLMAAHGGLKAKFIVSPIPPPPAPNYPNPVPDAVNKLTVNSDYRFVVTAALMEYGRFPDPSLGGRGDGMSTMWGQAKTRDGSMVKETKTVVFRTGPMQVLQVNALPTGLQKLKN
ncbi:hypothetical protein WG904_16210 [Pedobacter sp. Du54]|uniref:hypothetical protein n=1 Tax=Pedobacter anseongensis TaxID=3133439 RepID=UPI0030AC373D